MTRARTMMEEQQNPYVGPRAFERDEKLYGRDREARELTDALIAERIVLLHAPSGAGKTSLLQSAVIPRLEAEGFRVSGPLRINAVPSRIATVRNRYIYSTVIGLADGENSDPAMGQIELEGVLEPLEEKADGSSAEHVLVFDQFEEILRLDPTDWEGQAAFFREVGAALENQGRWAVFSMREDFMGGLDRYLGQIPLGLQTRYRLDFLERPAAMQAIQHPARDLGVDFTDGAADLLVRDLSTIRVQRPSQEPELVPGPYIEPVQLQVVCHRLWKTLAKASSGHFTSIGEQQVKEHSDFDRALGKYYAEAVAEVAGETAASERIIRDWFETQLITVQGFRSQTLTGPDVDDVGDVLSGLQNRYLIRPDDRVGGTWLELAHDRLIDPIRTNNRTWRRRHLARWEFAADEWQRSGREASYLLRGDDIRRARRWLSRGGRKPNPLESEFLERSKETWAGRSLRMKIGTAIVALGAVVVVESIALILLLFNR